MRATTLLLLGWFCCAPVNVEDHTNGATQQSAHLRPNTTLQAKVTQIVDGDTLKVECPDGRILVVHLHAIDAPEKGQEYGPAATKATQRLLQGKAVTVRVRALLDSGEPSVDVDIPSGTPILPPERANTTLVQRGIAWHVTTAKPPVAWLADYQRQARLKRVGLWSTSKQPVPPWQWRKQQTRKP